VTTDDMVRRGTLMPRVATSNSVAIASEETGETVVHDFLGFTLAHEQYALPLRTVREILKPPPVTLVPRAPRDIVGIISVRGRVITVIDLRRRLRLEERPQTKASRVLLVDEGDELLGLLVDQVLQVFRLREEEVELAAAVGGDIAEYVLGIGRPTTGRVGGRFSTRTADRALDKEGDILILLDPKPLLRR
jgi:purine-binding chemotaxis protein CheW